MKANIANPGMTLTNETLSKAAGKTLITVPPPLALFTIRDGRIISDAAEPDSADIIQHVKHY